MTATLVWISIIASLLMGLAGACIFIFAVKKGYFHDFEEAKFQMFWSDLEEMVNSSTQQENHERGPHKR